MKIISQLREILEGGQPPFFYGRGWKKIDFILQYWIEFLFAIIVSGFSFCYRKLIEKMKESDLKQVAIEEGIQALLRDRIIQAYSRYIDKGFCPIYALEDIESLYRQYNALGGNGTVTKLLEKLKELPTENEG